LLKLVAEEVPVRFKRKGNTAIIVVLANGFGLEVKCKAEYGRNAIRQQIKDWP
jgi:hypothetical protein